MDRQGSVSRRDFLKLVGGIGVGAVVTGALGREGMNQLEAARQEALLDPIKHLTSEDLEDINSEKLRKCLSSCVQLFCESPEYTGVNQKYLTQHTTLHSTEQSFVDGVHAAGSTNYKLPEDGSFEYAVAVNSSQRVEVNLQGIRQSAQQLTEYPGLLLCKVMFHEWSHLLEKDNYSGVYLNNPQEIISSADDGHVEPWQFYRGGVIHTQTMRSLVKFNEGWNVLLTRKMVAETVQTDADLLAASYQLEQGDRDADRASRLARLVERAGISSKELADYHRHSQLETMLTRLGSVFSEDALAVLTPTQQGGRSPDEMHQQKDFLIGKGLAFAMAYDDWQRYDQLQTFMNAS